MKHFVCQPDSHNSFISVHRLIVSYFDVYNPAAKQQQETLESQERPHARPHDARYGTERSHHHRQTCHRRRAERRNPYPNERVSLASPHDHVRRVSLSSTASHDSSDRSHRSTSRRTSSVSSFSASSSLLQSSSSSCSEFSFFERETRASRTSSRSSSLPPPPRRHRHRSTVKKPLGAPRRHASSSNAEEASRTSSAASRLSAALPEGEWAATPPPMPSTPSGEPDGGAESCSTAPPFLYPQRTTSKEGRQHEEANQRDTSSKKKKKKKKEKQDRRDNERNQPTAEREGTEAENSTKTEGMARMTRRREAAGRQEITSSKARKAARRREAPHQGEKESSHRRRKARHDHSHHPRHHHRQRSSHGSERNSKRYTHAQMNTSRRKAARSVPHPPSRPTKTTPLIYGPQQAAYHRRETKSWRLPACFEGDKAFSTSRIHRDPQLHSGVWQATTGSSSSYRHSTAQEGGLRSFWGSGATPEGTSTTGCDLVGENVPSAANDSFLGAGSSACAGHFTHPQEQRQQEQQLCFSVANRSIYEADLVMVGGTSQALLAVLLMDTGELVYAPGYAPSHSTLHTPSGQLAGAALVGARNLNYGGSMHHDGVPGVEWNARLGDGGGGRRRRAPPSTITWMRDSEMVAVGDTAGWLHWFHVDCRPMDLPAGTTPSSLSVETSREEESDPTERGAQEVRSIWFDGISPNVRLTLRASQKLPYPRRDSWSSPTSPAAVLHSTTRNTSAEDTTKGMGLHAARTMALGTTPAAAPAADESSALGIPLLTSDHFPRYGYLAIASAEYLYIVQYIPPTERESGEAVVLSFISLQCLTQPTSAPLHTSAAPLEGRSISHDSERKASLLSGQRPPRVPDRSTAEAEGGTASNPARSVPSCAASPALSGFVSHRRDEQTNLSMALHPLSSPPLSSSSSTPSVTAATAFALPPALEQYGRQTRAKVSPSPTVAATPSPHIHIEHSAAFDLPWPHPSDKGASFLYCHPLHGLVGVLTPLQTLAATSYGSGVTSRTSPAAPQQCSRYENAEEGDDDCYREEDDACMERETDQSERIPPGGREVPDRGERHFVTPPRGGHQRGHLCGCLLQVFSLEAALDVRESAGAGGGWGVATRSHLRRVYVDFFHAAPRRVPLFFSFSWKFSSDLELVLCNLYQGELSVVRLKKNVLADKKAVSTTASLSKAKQTADVALPPLTEPATPHKARSPKSSTASPSPGASLGKSSRETHSATRRAPPPPALDYPFARDQLYRLPIPLHASMNVEYISYATAPLAEGQNQQNPWLALPSSHEPYWTQGRTEEKELSYSGGARREATSTTTTGGASLPSFQLTPLTAFHTTGHRTGFKGGGITAPEASSAYSSVVLPYSTSLHELPNGGVPHTNASSTYWSGVVSGASAAPMSSAMSFRRRGVALKEVALAQHLLNATPNGLKGGGTALFDFPPPFTAGGVSSALRLPLSALLAVSGGGGENGAGSPWTTGTGAFASPTSPNFAVVAASTSRRPAPLTAVTANTNATGGPAGAAFFFEEEDAVTTVRSSSPTRASILKYPIQCSLVSRAKIYHHRAPRHSRSHRHHRHRHHRHHRHSIRPPPLSPASVFPPLGEVEDQMRSLVRSGAGPSTSVVGMSQYGEVVRIPVEMKAETAWRGIGCFFVTIGSTVHATEVSNVHGVEVMMKLRVLAGFGLDPASNVKALQRSSSLPFRLSPSSNERTAAERLRPQGTTPSSSVEEVLDWMDEEESEEDQVEGEGVGGALPFPEGVLRESQHIGDTVILFRYVATLERCGVIRRTDDVPSMWSLLLQGTKKYPTNIHYEAVVHDEGEGGGAGGRLATTAATFPSDEEEKVSAKRTTSTTRDSEAAPKLSFSSPDTSLYSSASRLTSDGGGPASYPLSSVILTPVKESVDQTEEAITPCSNASSPNQEFLPALPHSYHGISSHRLLLLHVLRWLPPSAATCARAEEALRNTHFPPPPTAGRSSPHVLERLEKKVAMAALYGYRHTAMGLLAALVPYGPLYAVMIHYIREPAYLAQVLVQSSRRARDEFLRDLSPWMLACVLSCCSSCSNYLAAGFAAAAAAAAVSGDGVKRGAFPTLPSFPRYTPDARMQAAETLSLPYRDALLYHHPQLPLWDRLAVALLLEAPFDPQTTTSEACYEYVPHFPSPAAQTDEDDEDEALNKKRRRRSTSASSGSNARREPRAEAANLDAPADAVRHSHQKGRVRSPWRIRPCDAAPFEGATATEYVEFTKRKTEATPPPTSAAQKQGTSPHRSHQSNSGRVERILHNFFLECSAIQALALGYGISEDTFPAMQMIVDETGNFQLGSCLYARVGVRRQWNERLEHERQPRDSLPTRRRAGSPLDRKTTPQKKEPIMPQGGSGSTPSGDGETPESDDEDDWLPSQTYYSPSCVPHAPFVYTRPTSTSAPFRTSGSGERGQQGEAVVVVRSNENSGSEGEERLRREGKRDENTSAAQFSLSSRRQRAGTSDFEFRAPPLAYCGHHRSIRACSATAANTRIAPPLLHNASPFSSKIRCAACEVELMEQLHYSPVPPPPTHSFPHTEAASLNVEGRGNNTPGVGSLHPTAGVHASVGEVDESNRESSEEPHHYTSVEENQWEWWTDAYRRFLDHENALVFRTQFDVSCHQLQQEYATEELAKREAERRCEAQVGEGGGGTDRRSGWSSPISNGMPSTSIKPLTPHFVLTAKGIRMMVTPRPAARKSGVRTAYSSAPASTHQHLYHREMKPQSASSGHSCILSEEEEKEERNLCPSQLDAPLSYGADLRPVLPGFGAVRPEECATRGEMKNTSKEFPTNSRDLLCQDGSNRRTVPLSPDTSNGLRLTSQKTRKEDDARLRSDGDSDALLTEKSLRRSAATGARDPPARSSRPQREEMTKDMPEASSVAYASVRGPAHLRPCRQRTASPPLECTSSSMTQSYRGVCTAEARMQLLLESVRHSGQRCAVCGMTAARGVSSATSVQPAFVWCSSCRHGGHVDHIQGWFQAHRLCPVEDCLCRCNER